MKSTTIAALVKFCTAGEHIYCFPQPGSACIDIHGYGRPERPHAAIQSETLRIPDGTPVIDTREAVCTPRGFDWVYKGSMLKVGIEPGYTERCFGGCGPEKYSAQNPPEGLDYVGVADFVNGWKLHGARVGRYNGGQIVWEDEATPTSVDTHNQQAD
jgi:hypothetical protein